MHLLEHLANRGQGAALQTGIDYAVLKGADAIVTFDSDGQHDPADIPELLEPVLSDVLAAARCHEYELVGRPEMEEGVFEVLSAEFAPKP